MEKEEKQPPRPARDAEQDDAPQLPASFFSKLVNQPTCITRGVCNQCGRCEH